MPMGAPTTTGSQLVEAVVFAVLFEAVVAEAVVVGVVAELVRVGVPSVVPAAVVAFVGAVVGVLVGAVAVAGAVGVPAVDVLGDAEVLVCTDVVGAANLRTNVTDLLTLSPVLLCTVSE